MFSSLESQGAAQQHPVGHLEHPSRRHQLGPGRQRLRPGGGARTRFHFQTQLSDGTHRRRGVLQPEQQRLRHLSASCRRSRRTATPAFGPATCGDPRNPPLRIGRHRQRPGTYYRLPFSPYGIEALTPLRPATTMGRPIRRSAARRIRRASARSRIRPARRTTTC